MIIKATKNDLGRIVELFSNTLTPWNEDSVISSIDKDLCLVYVDNEISGVIVISKVLDEGEILNFAVDNKKRRQGIGSKLLAYAIEHDFLGSVETIFLDVRESNLSAISLYKKHGFEEYMRRKNFYDNPREDAILMKLIK